MSTNPARAFLSALHANCWHALLDLFYMKLPKLQQTKSTIRFCAKLFRPKATEKIGSWTLLTLPKNTSAKLLSQSMTMVEGTINGFPFRAALEPNGKGSHWLRVNKAMHDAARADAGDTVTVEITRAGEEPETRVPMDLEARGYPHFWFGTSSESMSKR
jgi:hypothetical protein